MGPHGFQVYDGNCAQRCDGPGLLTVVVALWRIAIYPEWCPHIRGAVIVLRDQPFVQGGLLLLGAAPPKSLPAFLPSTMDIADLCKLLFSPISAR